MSGKLNIEAYTETIEAAIQRRDFWALVRLCWDLIRELEELRGDGNAKVD